MTDLYPAAEAQLVQLLTPENRGSNPNIFNIVSGLAYNKAVRRLAPDKKKLAWII